MNIRDAIDAAVQLAKAGAVVFPPLAGGAALAEKALDILDDLKGEAPDAGTKEEVEQAHQELYDAMTSKGHALSDRLRG
jgi:hypothetical protein